MHDRLILGQTLAFAGDPFLLGPEAAHHERRGAILIRDGKIFTSPLANSVLNGITRASVIQIAKDFGIEVTERLPLTTRPNDHNLAYLLTKRDRMGHDLPDLEGATS